MIKGKTNSGFEFQYEDEVMNDMEIMDAIVELETGESDIQKIHGYGFLLTKILGKDGKKALYDHVRLKSGRVPIEAIDAELIEIISASKNGKN